MWIAEDSPQANPHHLRHPQSSIILTVKLMGIQFFIVFALSIIFLSMGVTGCRDFASVMWENGIPKLNLEANTSAITQCVLGFLLFFISLYLMGFFLYLEERESGRIMKNIKSFVKLRQFLERHQKEETGE